MRSPPTPCWRKWEPTGPSFATSMPSLPGPASVPTIMKSGGKVLSAKTRRSANRVHRALRPAAQALERSTSYRGIFYRRLCTRLGRPAGITATAHKLARIIFHMVTSGQAYDQSIFAAEEQRQRKHLESSLRRKAAQLGYQLT